MCLLSLSSFLSLIGLSGSFLTVYRSIKNWYYQFFVLYVHELSTFPISPFCRSDLPFFRFTTQEVMLTVKGDFLQHVMCPINLTITLSVFHVSRSALTTPLFILPYDSGRTPNAHTKSYGLPLHFSVLLPYVHSSVRIGFSSKL